MPTADRAPSLFRPLPLLAVLVLLLNDHVFKGAGLLPGWLTGKLSDVAGLFFFPVLLAAVLARVLPLRVRTRVWLSAALTAGVFAAVKVSPVVNAVVSRAWGGVVLDPTDLVALPFAALSAWWMLHAPRAVPGRLAERFSFVLAAVASMATSPNYRPCMGRDVAPLPHAKWDMTCAKPAPVVARVDRKHVELVFQPAPASESCEMPLGVGLAVRTQDGYAEVDVRKVQDTTIGEPLHMEMELPIAATCAEIRVQARTYLAPEKLYGTPGRREPVLVALPLDLSCDTGPAATPKEVP